MRPRPSPRRSTTHSNTSIDFTSEAKSCSHCESKAKEPLPNPPDYDAEWRWCVICRCIWKNRTLCEISPRCPTKGETLKKYNATHPRRIPRVRRST